MAASLAYYAFLAIPALLLVTLGVFANVAGQDTVNSILDTLDGVIPPEAIQLLDESLTRTLENQGGGVALIVIGGLLALWTATSAMGGLMRGLNRVYGTKETRSFGKQRLTGLAILGCVLVAFALVFGLLILGPVLSTAVGDATDATTLVGWLWWTLQWPIVLLGLLLAFAAILYFGPNVEVPKFRFITPGALLAVVLWILASGCSRSTSASSARTTRPGVARCGDRDADLALADRARAPPRRRGQRGGRAQPAPPRGTLRTRARG